MRESSVDAVEKVKMLKYSVAAISSVFLAESIAGMVSGSLAILSDSVHALFDTLSSLMLFISMRASLQPPDEEHMYGHEKFESTGGLLGSLVLIALSIMLSANSISRILGNESLINLEFSIVGFAVLGYTACIDILRVFIFRHAYASKSPTVKAGFYHALSDFGSTLVAFFGFWLSVYGILYGDAFASLILCSLLIFLSAKLAWNSIMELSDAAPKEVVNMVREEIQKADSMLKYENLKVRKSGEKFYIRANLKVPDSMSLEEAHDLSAKIESNVKRNLGEADISFHIEPSGIEGVSTELFVERIVSKIKGVKGIHDVKVAHYGGKNYVTLHVQVDPATALSEAHKIAENVEKVISEKAGNIENVLVHIEPSNIELRRGYAADEEEIRQIVEAAAEEFRDILKIKRVVTYIADFRRHIDVECIFNKDLPVEKAHKIASQIEEIIREKISETAVTVHIEPGN
ncbi:cation-efflux pump [Candidatus Bathyarchaeota archaeon]|nr:cation-efflux pump [Candidatus Bathyarchaeota archaeon]